MTREYGAVEGGIETIDRLAGFVAESGGGSNAALTTALPNEREIVMRRDGHLRTGMEGGAAESYDRLEPGR